MSGSKVQPPRLYSINCFAIENYFGGFPQWQRGDEV